VILPQSDRLPTELPAKYERLFPWRLDRRSVAVREVAGDLAELWGDLGGVENLSTQQRWLCERVVYMRRRMIDYETAIMGGTVPVLDAGTYSNFANVCQGHLKSLGLERRAADVTGGLQKYLAKSGTKRTRG
jgi:hypothetical protein